MMFFIGFESYIYIYIRLRFDLKKYTVVSVVSIVAFLFLSHFVVGVR